MLAASMHSQVTPFGGCPVGAAQAGEHTKLSSQVPFCTWFGSRLTAAVDVWFKFIKMLSPTKSCAFAHGFKMAYKHTS